MASGAPVRAACVVSFRYPCTHVSERTEIVHVRCRGGNQSTTTLNAMQISSCHGIRSTCQGCLCGICQIPLHTCSERAALNTSPMHRYQLLTHHARKGMMVLVLHARSACNVLYGSLHCSRTSSENPACVVHSVQYANACILSCSVALQAP
jgi:hypothetical protein